MSSKSMEKGSIQHVMTTETVQTAKENESPTVCTNSSPLYLGSKNLFNDFTFAAQTQETRNACFKSCVVDVSKDIISKVVEPSAAGISSLDHVERVVDGLMHSRLHVFLSRNRWKMRGGNVML